MGIPFVLLILMTASYLRADEEAFKTKTGNPLKVIVRTPTALHRDAEATSPSEPVDVFQFFYQLPTETNGKDKVKNGFIRVATAAQSPRAAGWIPADACVEWPHAQVAGFTPQGGRDRVLFFASQADAVSWLNGVKGSDQRAISQEPSSQVSSLFPLLDIQSIQHDGQDVPVYKVAYLNGTATPNQVVSVSGQSATRSSSEKGPVTRQELQDAFVLQVAFVIDTTASMQPWIDGMKTVIGRVATELSNNPALKGRVEFALVAYRDQLDPATPAATVQQMEFVTKVYCDLTADHVDFQGKLQTVREAQVSSEDFPEDGLAALKVGVQELQWKKPALKVIVLIGDAPFQTSPDGYKNVHKLTIPGLLALAQPTGAEGTWSRIQIHGLRIVSEMAKETEEHFREITTGRDFAGLHYAYQGAADADKFVTDLTAKLSELGTVTAQVAQGKFIEVEEKVQAAPAGSERQRLLGPILDMLKATEGTTTGPSFGEGFAIVLDREGNRCLEPHVLASQAQLKLFASALQHVIVSLETAGDPGNRNVPKLVQSLQVLATGINLKEDVHADMPLNELLSKVLGFPVRNPIFAITPAKLAAMTGADYERWVNSVRASESITKSHVENGSIWFKLGRSAKSHDLQAFIKVSDLP